MYATIADVEYLLIYPLSRRMYVNPGERVRIIAWAIEGPEARTSIRTEDDFALTLEQGEEDFLILEHQEVPA